MNEEERVMVLKHKMYGILKQMVKLTDKGNILGFKRKNREYSNLYGQLFGNKKDKESIDWDQARNELTYILSAKANFLNGKTSKEVYEKRKVEWWVDALKKFEQVKQYLT